MKPNFFHHGCSRLAATAALAGIVALAGCSSTPTKVDKGPVKAATFNFVNGGVPPNADLTENNEQVHATIQAAITHNLAAKGVTRATGLGDITVAYLIITGDNWSTMSVNKYFGYGRDSNALQEKANDAYTGQKNPNYFRAGTLVIDIVDNHTQELLWRSYVTRPLLKDPSPAVRQAHIQEAVDAALVNLHIVH
jgi:hypothetical protein